MCCMGNSGAVEPSCSFSIAYMQCLEHLGMHCIKQCAFNASVWPCWGHAGAKKTKCIGGNVTRVSGSMQTQYVQVCLSCLRLPTVQKLQGSSSLKYMAVCHPITAHALNLAEVRSI